MLMVSVVCVDDQVERRQKKKSVCKRMRCENDERESARARLARASGGSDREVVVMLRMDEGGW